MDCINGRPIYLSIPASLSRCSPPCRTLIASTNSFIILRFLQSLVELTNNLTFECYSFFTIPVTVCTILRLSCSNTSRCLMSLMGALHVHQSFEVEIHKRNNSTPKWFCWFVWEIECWEAISQSADLNKFFGQNFI